MVQVKLAQSMLLKKNLKKTRNEHPLFARGFDSKLRFEISEKGLYVALPAAESKSGSEECLMNQSMNKIAFVSSIGKTLYVMMKRTGAPGRFKCHAFDCASEAEATALTQTLSRVANEVFAKLRHVTRLLEAQAKKAAGPPVVPKRVEVKDEDQPWYAVVLHRCVLLCTVAGVLRMAAEGVQCNRVWSASRKSTPTCSNLLLHPDVCDYAAGVASPPLRTVLLETVQLSVLLPNLVGVDRQCDPMLSSVLTTRYSALQQTCNAHTHTRTHAHAMQVPRQA